MGLRGFDREAKVIIACRGWSVGRVKNRLVDIIIDEPVYAMAA